MMAGHARATNRIPPPPPPSETTSATDTKPAPPPSTAEPDAPPKTRKLEEAGFHHTPYYKIRAAVANLRDRFLQVTQATGPQKEGATVEITNEMKVLLELSRNMRLDISAGAEPVKPLDIPAISFAKSKREVQVPSREKNQVPQVRRAPTFLHNTGEKILKPVSVQTAANRSKVRSQRQAKPSQLGERVRGSYVIGGSPMGWNFLMWHGGKVVYYGMTRAEWLARQAAK